MIPISITGFLKVYDPNNNEVFYDGHNAIHYENISVAIADCLSSRSFGSIFKMAFGNGGASVDETGVITYLPPNTTGQNTALYNQTYAKIVDDTSVFNLDPTRNKMTVSHTTGKVYTDILVQCLLDYGEPNGQALFDNSQNINGEFVFDNGISGTISKAWQFPVAPVISILNLLGDKTLQISDQGALQIIVDSGTAEYTYTLPAQVK
mgnify:CR=1 FL=1